MFKTLVAVALCSLGAACAGLQATTNTWCYDGLVPNAQMGREIEVGGVQVIHVQEERLPTAFKRLSRRSVVEITREAAHELAAEGAAVGDGRFYLIRSGVFADEEASAGDLNRAHEQVSKHVFQIDEVSDHLSIFVFQGINSTSLYDYPLLVKAPFDIRSANAYCDTHY